MVVLELKPGYPRHRASVVSPEHLPFGTVLNSQNYDIEICSGSEEGSHLRLIDFCITQL